MKKMKLLIILFILVSCINKNQVTTSNDLNIVNQYLGSWNSIGDKFRINKKSKETGHWEIQIFPNYNNSNKFFVVNLNYGDTTDAMISGNKLHLNLNKDNIDSAFLIFYTKKLDTLTNVELNDILELNINSNKEIIYFTKK